MSFEILVDRDVLILDEVFAAGIEAVLDVEAFLKYTAATAILINTGMTTRSVTEPISLNSSWASMMTSIRVKKS